LWSAAASAGFFCPISGFAEVINALFDTSGVSAAAGTVWEWAVVKVTIDNITVFQSKDRSFTLANLAGLSERGKVKEGCLPAIDLSPYDR
jgi:hypothetical protein